MNMGQINFIIKNILENSKQYSENEESSDLFYRISSEVQQALNENLFHFEQMETLHLNKNGKIRIVKQYDKNHYIENILSIYIKNILDVKFRVVYPNRNKIIKSLFNIIAALVQMENFTIVRFDFKDYFNSISSEYVFKKYIKDRISKRDEMYLIENYVNATKFAYAGLCTSNSIAEIISKNFDKSIYQSLLSDNIIFYERYIDDGILIFNDHIEQHKIKELLSRSILKIFYDNNIIAKKCKTRLNSNKFKYLSRNDLSQSTKAIDFLGYEFYLSCNPGNNNNIKIEYGITEEKRKKYEKKIDKIISLYTQSCSHNTQELELLRQRIAAFSSRQVYVNRYKNKNIWHVKGFISNYGELRFFLNTENLIEYKTEKFLKEMIIDAFNRANLHPYFLNNNFGYNLYTNMKSNKTLLFVQGLGYSYQSLVKLCKKIGINEFTINNKRRKYNSLVKEYLIKVKVGY